MKKVDGEDVERERSAEDRVYIDPARGLLANKQSSKQTSKTIRSTLNVLISRTQDDNARQGEPCTKQSLPVTLAGSTTATSRKPEAIPTA